MFFHFRAVFLVALLALSFSGCGQKAAPATPQVEKEETALLAGKKIAMLIAHKDFRDEEYQTPRKLFEAQGATVKVASSSLEEAGGMLGAKVKPDMLLKDVKVAEYDAIIFVGGSGATEYWDDPTAHAIAKEAVEKGKVLAAICIAPATLAKAGVLKGKKATVFSSAAGELKAAGCDYTGQPVERDGKIITANGPDAAEKFAAEVIKALRE